MIFRFEFFHLNGDVEQRQLNFNNTISYKSKQALPWPYLYTILDAKGKPCESKHFRYENEAYVEVQP